MMEGRAMIEDVDRYNGGVMMAGNSKLGFGESGKRAGRGAAFTHL
jgi:hypothetical protein